MIETGHLRRAVEVCLKNEERTGRAPRPYQLEAVAWALRSSCLLALDMGLGKTYCALMAWSAIRPAKTAIVVPTSAKSVWVDELAFLFGKVKVIELLGVRKLRARSLSLGEPPRDFDFSELDPDEAQIYLIGHDVVSAYGPIIQARASGGLLFSKAALDKALLASGILEAPDMVIVDESHCFGSNNSARTRGLYGLTCQSRRTILLSGTPLAGGIDRLYPQLQLVAPARAWGKYWDFVIRYAGGEENEWGGITPTSATNTQELKDRTEDLILSKRKEEVASNLPKHIRQRVTVFVTPKAYTDITGEIDGFMKQLRDRELRQGDERFLQGEVTRIMGRLAMHKIASVAKYLKEHLEHQRVLVWTWHRHIAREIQDALKNRVSFRVDGSFTPDECEFKVDRWSKTYNGVLVATIAKLGTGYDRLAHHCQEQIVVELPWLPEILEQALARLVRLSQPGEVVTTRLFHLQVPFEKSLCDRLLSRATETDGLLGSSMQEQVGSLFGNIDYSPEVLEQILKGVDNE